MTQAVNILKTILKPLASLKLTVALLVMSMIVIFAGTWAQIDHGIWDVQARYFHSYFTWIDFQLFLPRPDLSKGEKPFPGALPMLGGYSLIILLLVNLLAAHSVRFKLSWKRSGIILTHLGLIMLLVGELVTSLFAVESQMPIEEGSYANYSHDIRHAELAVVDNSPADHDDVVIVPETKLKTGATVRDAKLPFEVRVDEYHANSRLLGPMQLGPGTAQAKATAGDGVGLGLSPRAKFGGVQGSDVDTPSAYVTLTSNGGQPLGTYLVSLLLDKPQTVTVDGKPYGIQLRFRRYYKPYTVHLKDFTAEYYKGTDKPKRYESLVRLVDPTRGVDRDIRIFMNSPLRYHGETFFQASFVSPSKDRPWDTTVLQVVDNPGWFVPYLACLVGALGMLIHFGMALVSFLRKQLAPAEGTVGAMARPAPKGAKGAKPQAAGAGGRSYVLQPTTSWRGAALLFPAGVVAVCLMYVVSAMRPVNPSAPYNVAEFAKIPLTYQGRTQPLDSLATNSLRIISGKSIARVGQGDTERRVPAAQWLLDVMAAPKKSHDYKVFRIDHPDIKSLLSLSPDEKLFSVNQIMLLDDPSEEKRMERLEKLQSQADAAAKADKGSRDLYQTKMLELGQHLQLYMTLQQIESLLLVPPASGGSDQWRPIGDVAREARQAGTQMNPAALKFLTILDAYADGRADDFNREVRAYRSMIASDLPVVDRRAGYETFFNGFAPFYVCMVLYATVFALAALSWLGWRPPLARAAFWVVLLALAVHTFGLASRMYLMRRPPITNLYSSAIYVGWFAVVMSVLFERVFRNGLGSFAASVIGFVTLLIAHHLSGDGDTMEMLQAVLDTNLWLATHVTIINMAYTAVALTGVFGIVYVVVGVFSNYLDLDFSKVLARMIYGATCFGILFSFVGTILGGIWADQSWGRFWGWDPKENGAAMVVLWTAVMLHARWGGVVRERGLACMAIFANVMLAWSWFGTNMLGVGLHAYGFMSSAVFWISLFVISQLALIAIGLFVPMQMWRSSAVLGAREFGFSPKMAAARAG